MNRPFSYLVLGTGVGKAVAAWLLQQGNAKRVTLADNDYRRAQEAVETIAPHEFKAERLMPTFFSTDHLDNNDLYKTFQRFDVVISAIPAKHSLRLSSLSSQAGAHFCDLGGVMEITQAMREKDDEARALNRSVIPDCGLMPGLGNMLAQNLLGRLGIADDITIYVGGIPQKPQPPHNYQRIFSLEGLLHILTDSPILRGGKVVMVPPGSELQQLHVSQLEGFNGMVEAFITAGAGTAYEDFARQGVQNFCEKTIRWPGFLPYINGIPRAELLDRLAKDLPPTDAEHPDLVYMRVIASRKDNGWNASWELLDTYDPVSGLTAMQRTTGFSAAAVAYMAALGRTKQGVNPPETALTQSDLSQCLDMLQGSLKLCLTENYNK